MLWVIVFMDMKKKQIELAGFIGKLLRDNFGKGPESVFTTISPPFIFVSIQNFISPVEEALLKQDELNTVQNTREILMQTLAGEIRAYMKIITGMEIEEFYYDWNLNNKSGAITAVTNGSLSGQQAAMSDYPHQEELHRKVVEISHEVQKVPEKIFSCRISDRVLLIIREGILVRIEKELIKQGYSKILKTTKRVLEKSYLHNNEVEQILGVKVEDIFVDWDFTRDKSVFALTLRPDQ
ncbi:uncharacterized protein YbcI [Mesobacillus foraminis]|uniref:Uncharacterized protein YbcI n=2 Tax=Mesobacillus foraminis TaxID=279826 RepID=A0A4R2B439_9BACI|nr:uncharacterized protein YbcI [Mesobacillus foraminis]